MSTLTNAQISRTYKVSRPTVGNWIKQAITKENLLKLINLDGKYHISNTVHNHNELTRLRDEGRKYRTYSSLKKHEIPEQFYKIFNPEHALEIVNDLEFRSELNLKYNYFSDGATYWDKYYLEEVYNFGRSIEEVLVKSLDIIQYNLQYESKINIIDLGSGNAFPTKLIITPFYDNNILNKYIGLDISPDILRISTNNLKNWYPNLIIESKEVDLEAGGFGGHMLKYHSFEDRISNLIFLFGNTIVNIDDRIQVLKNIRRGMVKSDIFVANYVITGGENSVNLDSYKNKYAELHGEWLLSLLGFDVESCEVSLYYDDVHKRKVKSLILDKDYELTFNLGLDKRIVHLSAGSEIIRWKQYLLSTQQIMEEIDLAGLKIIDLMLDDTKSNALVICEVKP